MSQDYINKTKPVKSDTTFESSQSNNNLTNSNSGIKFKFKKFFSTINLSKTNNEIKKVKSPVKKSVESVTTTGTSISSDGNLSNTTNQDASTTNIAPNRSNLEMTNDLIPRQELHSILSNRIMKEKVVDELLEKVSNETKLKLAKSNLNLNEPLENSDSIRSFINSIEYIKDYLKVNENNILKYIAPINEEITGDSKKKKNSQIQTNDSCYLIIQSLSIIENFKLLINTASSSFVDEVLKQKGLDSIVDLLDCLKYEWRYHAVHYNLIYCFKGILNSKNGFKAILNHERALSVLVQSIFVSDIKIKIKVIEIISPLCLWKIGREKVLGAFDHFKSYARESFRFQYIVNLLAFQEGYDESLKEKLRIAVMSLINLVIGKNSQDDNIFDDLEERLTTRMEFLKLGLQDIITDLIKNNSNSALERHLDYYEFRRITDESCYLEVSNEIDDFAKVDKPFELETKVNDSKYYFEKIDNKIRITSMNLNWLSILENLFLMSSTKEAKKLPQLWYLIDRIVSDIVHGEKKIEDFDQIIAKATESLELQDEVKELTFRLDQANEEIKALVQENETLVREIAEMRESLNEQMNLKRTAQMEIENLKENMNKEFTNASTPINHGSKKLNLFRQIETSSPLNETNNILTPNSSSSFFNPESMLSPIKPTSLPLPPPPPPAPPIGSINTSIKKNIPKSEFVMKPLHINKISPVLTDTIWKNVDDTQHYQVVDFKKIEEAFSVGSEENSSLSGSQSRSTSLMHVSQSDQINNTESLTSLPTVPKMIFTDAVRAINVTVARRRLPSCDELINMIENMDPNNALGETELQNLLQLVLTPEEKASLYSCYLPQMDELHNCLYKISKIAHYQEKLEIIGFKNSLKEKEKADYYTNLNIVKECCTLLRENKNVLKLFEVLLCIVNYVNQSNQNGNAFGFKINFLNKLSEIKTNNRDLTLLNYLVMMIKEKYPGLLKLPEELDLVKKVAVFNITEFGNEIRALDDKMQKIEKLIDRIQKDKINFDKNKKFLHAMCSFYKETETKIKTVKNQYNEAIKQYTDTAKYFGESGAIVNFNEFFAMWSTFLKSFSAARDQLDQKIQTKTMNQSIYLREIKKAHPVRKRISHEIDFGSSLTQDTDFVNVCLKVQSGEIFNASKALRREIRNRTKSSNLSKGTASRSRSPSIS